MFEALQQESTIYYAMQTTQILIRLPLTSELNKIKYMQHSEISMI